ncbi:GPI ethanolamine phosphate transferase 1 [Fagus crenata]
MRVSDGILGNRDIERSKATITSTNTRRKWLKRRETWLVVLGVILHAVYMLSIFDISFKTPIVHGMDPVTPRFNAPAKRLVLLVADGLRADKFFEPDSEGNYRAPFLRSIIKGQGRWGVSHARPPTESRPGHVALIAGFYEDPSAVTKGWKANPVEFDSVFNRSRHTISFGSPDIVPIFCGAVPHSTWNTYPHEFEDFATDASFLDEWSFDQFQSLLNRSNEDSKLKELLQQDKLVIFLHLLGCDSNGHAHRPYSSIYLNNVKVVDSIAERVYHLVEDHFKDNRTAYIFTADHGMSDKGSHGDGHPSNTDTPLVAWGAGVKYPKPISSTKHSHCSFRFVDEHMHDAPTPIEWGLNEIERVDVNQADIAPLMVSSLVGLPCPVNSVGSLPLDYVNMIESNSLYFKPFKQLANYSAVLDQIERLISVRNYEAAMKLSENLRSLALQGLHYFQTYDWLMLMTVITLGYEAVFYSALALVLMAWILFENTVLYLSKVKKSSTSIKNVEDHLTLEHDTRCLQLSDVRIPLVFMVLFNVAFFGTGNFASIASFEISSVYQFITVFSVTVSDGSPAYIQAIYTVLACHVRNTGSWMEIGNSISHFGIVSAQVVFVLLLFALTNVRFFILTSAFLDLRSASHSASSSLLPTSAYCLCVRTSQFLPMGFPDVPIHCTIVAAL